MKRSIRFVAALSLWAALALALAGCGHSSNSFTWQVDQVPDNLDPQLASSSANRIAVTHLYSGLFRLGADGQVNSECAQSYTVSPDGLTYTFQLKSGLEYQGAKGKATPYSVTAQDFVFGLQRVFLPQTGSPYAAELGNIQGSAEVLAGGDASQLGVRALDELTLEIQLNSPDNEFLKKLCLPGAMPCNEEFFKSTGGAYGLTRDTTIGNGSFYLYNWTESGLFLRRPASGKQVDNLRLVLASTAGEAAASSGSGAASQPPTPAQLVAGGKCDAALALGDGSGAAELAQLPYTTTTWALVFNCSDGEFASQALRAALAAVAWDTPLELPAGCTAATSLLPPGMGLASAGLPDLGQPAALYRQGLLEADVPNLTGLTVLVPTGYSQMFGALNQEWQKQLQAFFSVKELPLSTLYGWVNGQITEGERTRLEYQYGAWRIALLPLSPASSDPASLLRLFDGRLGSWQNSAYHSGLTALEQMPSGVARRQAAAQLEQALLAQCPVAPLFYQSNALLVNPQVQGLVFDPFGPMLDVTYATKG